jgi:Carboxypeptidase regulatory-like domain
MTAQIEMRAPLANQYWKLLRENQMQRQIQNSLAAFLAVVMGAFALSAQSVSVLRGQVMDDVNAVIPGAVVTLTSVDGKARTATTNAAGEFALANVAPGRYQVSVVFEGFQPYLNRELLVTAAPAPLKIVMAVAAVTVETTVSAEDPANTTEPDKNLNALVLGEEQIRDILADNEDDMREQLSALAGPAGAGGAQFVVDGFSGGRLPPKEAIFQVRINQNPFSAEYAQTGFGRIEIITKPGNDKWRGSAGYSVRNSGLDARNAFALVKPDVSQNRYQFNLSGTLIPKKMSFFTNAERRGLEGGSTVNATTLDGPFVANVDAPNTSTFFNLRTDYLLDNRNTLNLSYNLFRNDAQNREFAVRFGGFGFGGPGGGGGFGGGGAASGGANYTLPERGTNSASTNHTFQLGETFIVNASLINEARLRFQLERSASRPVSPGLAAINVLDAFNGGGATVSSDSRGRSLEFQNYLTWTHRKHTVKGGIQFQHETNRNDDASNFNGTYTFSSLEQYRRVLAGETLSGLDAARFQYAVNRGATQLDYGMYQAAWFVQDDWRVNQTLTLSFGLRHEFQQYLQDRNNLAPRASLAWSPFKDRKTTLRIGGGVFYSRLNGSLFENTLRIDGVRQQSIVIRNPLYPDPFAGDPVVSATNTIRRTLEANLRAPYTINFSAGVERQLPKGVTGAFTYLFTRGLHQFRTRNINAPLADGTRPLGDVGNVYEVGSSARSQYHGFQFRADRRLGRGFNVFTNYTLSWTQSDADGAMTLPADNYDLGGEWGRSTNDRRHSIFAGGRVSLPRGFSLSPFVTASSGAPFNITTGADDNRDTAFSDRPLGIARNAGLPANLYPSLTNRCIAGCTTGGARVTLLDYLMTNYPTGVTAEGPGNFNVNLNISKTLSFGKRNESAAQPAGGPGGGGARGPGGMFGGGPGGPGGMFGGGDGRFNVSLSAQISNLLNRVNFGQFGGVLGSPYFGRSSSALGARQIELSVRFSF